MSETLTETLRKGPTVRGVYPLRPWGKMPLPSFPLPTPLAPPTLLDVGTRRVHAFELLEQRNLQHSK